MNESRARTEVNIRALGRCELPTRIRYKDRGRWITEDVRCPQEGAEWSHRLARGRMGLWTPSNGLRACHRCHDYLHDHPALAEAGGWHLASDSEPATSPVYLLEPFPGWWLLDDLLGDGGDHVVRLYPDLIDAPELMPGRITEWAA